MLKGSWGVTYAKEHDFRFEEPSSGLEGSFLLVTVANLNIIISPSDVKFAKELHSLEVLDTFYKIW
jgi:hypothetical protein